MADKKLTPEEITERRAALAKAKAERDAQAQAQADRVQAEQDLADEEALDKAEQEFGQSFVYQAEEAGRAKIAVIKTALGSVIVHRPEPIVWKRWSSNPKSGEKENFELAAACLVYPTKTKLQSMLDEKPVLLVHVVKAISELAGARKEDLGGK